MRCHDCGRPADIEVESDGVIVGLCEDHLRDHVESIAGEHALDTLNELLGREER